MRNKFFRKIFILLSVLMCMASAAQAASTNKGYDLQTTGSNRGLWGSILNSNLTIIDKNVGGRVDANVAGSSNITVSAGNAQYLYHKLAGILTGNIQYILPDSGGFYIIENATTGSFSVTVDNALGGTGVAVPQGKTMLVYSDADNNAVLSGITYIAGVLLPSNNLSDVSNTATAFTNIKQAASESATGVCELATTGEAAGGVDTSRCVTAAGVASAISALTPSVSGVPVGSVFFFGGASEPTGYLLGYGQAVSRTTYSDLFAVVGTVYGTGNGSTTFNVPDCRGRFIAGKDNMGGSAASRLTNPVTGGIAGSTLGGTGGEQSHVLTVAEMPAHTHTFSGQLNTSRASGSASAFTGGSTTTSSTGGDAAHNNVPPAIILNCIIKY